MIYKNAITYRAYNSGGPGGQHGNRSENAIEATLSPEVASQLGIPAVSASAGLKSQHQSKRAAQRLLRARIRAELDRKSRKGRNSAGSARVRNYHEPDNRVQDAGGQHSYRHTVGKGNLSECIDGLRAARICG